MLEERIYFDEEVRGHKLLVTSRIIAFKGTVLDTIAADSLTISVYRHSVNAIPSSASYLISVSGQNTVIDVDTARVGGFFWLGKQQFDRLRAAVIIAVGQRLFDQSIRKLYTGGELVFQHRRHRITVSPQGVRVQRSGLLSSQEFEFPWRYLRMKQCNGNYILQSYANKKSVTLPTWQMPNNFVFQTVLTGLLDKAKYRLLSNPNGFDPSHGRRRDFDGKWE